jgi:hypothetical protein
VDSHAVAVLGAADDAQDQVVQLRRRPEQQPALQGAGCDFYEGILGNEAKRSWHTWVSAMSWNSCSKYDSGTVCAARRLRGNELE